MYPMMLASTPARASVRHLNLVSRGVSWAGSAISAAPPQCMYPRSTCSGPSICWLQPGQRARMASRSLGFRACLDERIAVRELQRPVTVLEVDLASTLDQLALDEREMRVEPLLQPELRFHVCLE